MSAFQQKFEFMYGEFKPLPTPEISDPFEGANTSSEASDNVSNVLFWIGVAVIAVAVVYVVYEYSEAED